MAKKLWFSDKGKDVVVEPKSESVEDIADAMLDGMLEMVAGDDHSPEELKQIKAKMRELASRDDEVSDPLVNDLLGPQPEAIERGMLQARKIARSGDEHGLEALEAAMNRLSPKEESLQFFRTEAPGYKTSELWRAQSPETREWHELEMSDFPCTLHLPNGQAAIGEQQPGQTVPDLHGLLTSDAQQSLGFDASANRLLELAGKQALLADPIDAGFCTYAVLLFGIGLDTGSENIPAIIKAIRDTGSDSQVHAFQLLATHIQIQGEWKTKKQPVIAADPA